MDKTAMSSVEFVSTTLRSHVAPAGSASGVKGRIRQAARLLGWTHSRTKDAWYADPRISISSDEMRAIEEYSGVRYGKEEARELRSHIARADALLEGQDTDLHWAALHALRSVFGFVDRP